MNKKIELTAEEIATITEQDVGVIELSDQMLEMVAGGSHGVSTTIIYTTC
jgi:hypothetical protein